MQERIVFCKHSLEFLAPAELFYNAAPFRSRELQQRSFFQKKKVWIPFFCSKDFRTQLRVKQQGAGTQLFLTKHSLEFLALANNFRTQLVLTQKAAEARLPSIDDAAAGPRLRRSQTRSCARLVDGAAAGSSRGLCRGLQS